MRKDIRNLAIIAHVDHGKTTLVDQLLRQTGAFLQHQEIADRVMDSGDLERERGITITAKNCSINYESTHINIIDTPGHADFGGEVERILSMVDGVLLLVDAVEGPMPQTRFVTKKALELGIRPIVVVNKVDRAGSRANWVIDRTFDLFDELGATDEQLDFFVIYASALQGWASNTLGVNKNGDLRPLFDAILEHIPASDLCTQGSLLLQIASLDYSSFVGRIGIGRVARGVIRKGQEVAVFSGPNQQNKTAKVGQLLKFQGLEKMEIESAGAGEIVLVNGIDAVEIGTTLSGLEEPMGLPIKKVDEPTLNMDFVVNTSPLSGKDGKFVTSRKIRERLETELHKNVALRVQFEQDADYCTVSGRGELHLTILLENMRREGYEVAVSRPRVVYKTDIDGSVTEPYERLTIDIPDQYQGSVMDELGNRGGKLLNIEPLGNLTTRLEYRLPAKGLIGFQSQLLNITKGTGVATSIHDGYDKEHSKLDERRRGVLISGFNGIAVAYSLWKLQERGKLFVSPGDPVYEGMIIGLNSRENDLVVNPIKSKQLTNIRASGKDESINLVPPIQLTLEKAVALIANDELAEITPKAVRLRKKQLKEYERKRALRSNRK